MKLANLIIVGGPISVGKSTLAASLGLPQIPELEENNKLQDILLEQTYVKGRVSPEVIEYFFLEIRKYKYAKYSNNLETNILDRSIFESLWFAKENMDELSFAHFKKLWKSTIDELIKEFGKPKLYILLTMKWDTFVDRLFQRGRDVEVKNFQSNEEFFRKHIKEYEQHMIEIFEMFNLNYKKIETDKYNAQQVANIALKAVKGVQHG